MKRFYILTVISAALLTGCGNTQKMDELIAAQTQPDVSTGTVPAPEVSVPDASNGEYDVDLTGLDSNMLYAQVYDMIFGDTDYNGKLVRAEGSFAYYYDKQSHKQYYAVLISDATACCAQGIEFELAEKRQYPNEFPEIGSDMIVHGIFDTYEDETGSYVRLLNAVIEEPKAKEQPA